jgi:hypothetical protein
VVLQEGATRSGNAVFVVVMPIPGILSLTIWFIGKKSERKASYMVLF